MIVERIPSLSPLGGETSDLPSLMLRLSMARGLDEIMQVVRKGARLLTGADGVTFVLREGDKCFYAEEDAISPLWKGQRFPAETCISGWAMIHRQPAVIEDIYRDDRIPKEAYKLTFVHSLIMVPVRTEDPVAAIGAYWAHKRKPAAIEVELLQTIANAAAVAMTNVALVNSLQHAAEEARRQAAEAERARAELERANQHKSRFLASCSHDLRQPFQAMRLFHSVLAARADGKDREVVERLGEAMTHGEELLQSLLDVSIIESGLMRPAPQSFPLQEVFDRLGLMFAEQAQTSGLHLSIVPTARRVTSDPLFLARILGNLVSNALKYTKGGVVVGARGRGDGLTVEVWDNGQGIPSEHLDSIFEDFYQVDNPERDKRRGIGLGLGIVRRLAAALGHPVSVRSRPGTGSVFSVALARG